MKSNTIPPSMLQLGEDMRCSLTLNGARSISHIEMRGSTYKGTNETRRRGHYYVDIEVYQPNGELRIIRSRTNMTAKQARNLHRQVTRKVAVFLWENRKEDVKPSKVMELVKQS
jgi:hypothetical protein